MFLAFNCHAVQAKQNNNVKIYIDKNEVVAHYVAERNFDYGGTVLLKAGEVMIFEDDVNNDGSKDLYLTDIGQCGKSCAKYLYICIDGSSACQKGYCYVGTNTNKKTKTVCDVSNLRD